MKLTLKVKKLSPHAIVPTYAHPGDAGMDIFASETVILKKGEYTKIPTGIAIELPEGYASLIWDRSGLATKHGIKTIGGVIDAGYRGEYMIGVVNLGKEDYTFERGHKIAQILIQKVEHPPITEVQELTTSPRGEGGFGSTGK